MEGPKGLGTWPRRFARCGIEPALKRLRSADFAAVVSVLPYDPLFGVTEPDLYGLDDRVGLDVLKCSEAGEPSPFIAPVELKLDGRVPARPRRREDFAVTPLSSGESSKSGKLSLTGDSGIGSRKGVEEPLEAGAHTCGLKPSCA